MTSFTIFRSSSLFTLVLDQIQYLCEQGRYEEAEQLRLRSKVDWETTVSSYK